MAMEGKWFDFIIAKHGNCETLSSLSTFTFLYTFKGEGEGVGAEKVNVVKMMIIMDDP